MFKNILIKPRGMASAVIVDERALNHLIQAQALLPSNIQLVLTRAFQRESFFLKVARGGGAVLFGIIFPNRKGEILDIFGHNGHATDGRHLDVGVINCNSDIKLLPFGVFTPLKKIKELFESNKFVLNNVFDALEKSKFSIHKNYTECMQIHCDFID
ncbi:hypothetical protein [Rufibacter quisquiliarum]|nr:hypothetical protein [Rufibacter quisquiliarum]